MPKKLTPLQLEYQKEYNRLVKGFNKYKKEGFLFPEEIVTKKPPKVTKKLVQSMKEIKPSQLKEVSEKVNIETGEIEKGLQKTTPNKVKQIKPQKTITKKTTPKSKTTSTPKSKTASEPTIKSKPQPQQITTEIPPTTEYYPTMSILDAVRERIESLPDTTRRGRGVAIAGRRNALLVIFEDNILSLDDDDIPAYEKYLFDNQHELFENLQVIVYASTEEKVDASFAKVAQILNYGDTLTSMQAESISSMQELYAST